MAELLLVNTRRLMVMQKLYNLSFNSEDIVDTSFKLSRNGLLSEDFCVENCINGILAGFDDVVLDFREE